MFDIGPLEILLICVVALLVVGPERLPAAVKTTSLWIGRFRRSFYKIKSEIERELNADEIKRQLYNESVLADLDDAKKQVTDLANETKDLAKDSTDLSEIADDKKTDDGSNKPPSENSIAGEIKSTSTEVKQVKKEVRKSMTAIKKDLSWKISDPVENSTADKKDDIS